jgi:macrolide transport system ATP-binding/permease protein
MNVQRFFQRRKEDADLAAELESHLAHEIDDNLARGMNPEEARRQAHLKLGNSLVIRDGVYESNRITWLEDLWRDLRYAVRILAKTPSFTFVALLVMALGIGANTAIYSFLDALLLRSLPVSDPSSLVEVKWHARSFEGDFVMQSMSGDVWSDSRWASVSDIFPYPAFSIFENNRVFSDVFAYCHTREVRSTNLLIKGQPETAGGELVSGRYFEGLGVNAASGRLIAPEDDRTGAPPVVVLSYGFAERHFGSAVAAAGQSIVISKVPFTVIGVAPPDFFGVDPSSVPDFYVPMQTKVSLGASDTFGFRQSDYLDGNYYWMQVMARLRPGVTLQQAQAELAPKFQQWVATTATTDQQRANLPALQLDPGGNGIDTLRRQFSKPFFLLMTLVALILAIACSNVANLLLARASSRRREIALRLSQGASRSRVIRQLLTESVLLSSAGAALGLAIASWGIRFLSASLQFHAGTIAMDAQLNWHVLGLTAGLALLTGIAFGLVPSIQSTKLELTVALKETVGTRQPVLHRSWWRAWPFTMSHILVVGQVALSLLILVAAGLFVRTLSNLQSINLGFNRDNVLLFDVNARQSGHRDPEISEFYFRLREQLAAIPGVRSASLARGSLISGQDQRPISVVGAPPDPENRHFIVGAYFLTTMQIPLLAGRDIDDRDRPGTPAVAVINEQFAKKNFPGQNPLGRHLILWDGDKPGRDMEIVGVAKNAQYGNLKLEIPPLIFIPFNQGKPILPNEMTFTVRTTGDPLAYVNSVRQIVHQADSRLPLSQIRTQKLEVEDGMREETVLAQLCSGFALLALTIAAVGLYGTISSTVARRTGEIGIRIALGAQRGPVLWMILREVLVLALVGLAISLPIALGTSKFLQSFLFQMRPNDPIALAAAVIILLAAAVLAGCVPARRAAHIDPMTALRHE